MISLPFTIILLVCVFLFVDATLDCVLYGCLSFWTINLCIDTFSFKLLCINQRNQSILYINIIKFCCQWMVRIYYFAFVAIMPKYIRFLIICLVYMMLPLSSKINIRDPISIFYKKIFQFILSIRVQSQTQALAWDFLVFPIWAMTLSRYE